MKILQVIIKILTAIVVNSFFTFLGFVSVLCFPFGRNGSGSGSSGGWIGLTIFSNNKDWVYFAIIFSLIVSMPFGIINGFILGAVKNTVIVPIMMSIVYSFIAVVFLSGSIHDLNDILPVLVLVTIFFSICLICNVATFYVIKWLFPNTPDYMDVVV